MGEEVLLGKIGRVSEEIPVGGKLGEVMLEVGGSSQSYNAFTEKLDRPVAVNERVVVVEHASDRTVLVTPY